jgi:RNA-binding protein FUS
LRRGANAGRLAAASARKKQKRGYPDQWPWNIRLYTDEKGAFKGDATVTFEDPNAAANAPKFFDGGDFKGNTIHVEVASASQAR